MAFGIDDILIGLAITAAAQAASNATAPSKKTQVTAQPTGAANPNPGFNAYTPPKGVNVDTLAKPNEQAVSNTADEIIGQIIAGAPTGTEATKPDAKKTSTGDILSASAAALANPVIANLLGLGPPPEKRVVMGSPSGGPQGSVIQGFNLPQRGRIGDILSSIPRAPYG